jgi:hypothetical protein
MRFDFTPPAACLHPRSEVRRRLDAGGRRTYWRQCLECGSTVGAMVASSVALAEGSAPPAFDEAARGRGREAVSRFYAEQRAARDRAWRDGYDAYLRSDAWRAKRVQALRRDNFQCQGCRERPATQVHHLTYAHVGDELLFELISICDKCHAHAHKERR